MIKVSLLVNPLAGKGKAISIAEKLKDLLDDWYLGGDIDYAVEGIHDKRIGGHSCAGEVVEQSLKVFECSGDWIATKDENDVFLDFSDPGYGVYGDANDQGRAKKEKGSGDNRSFTRELEED